MPILNSLYARIAGLSNFIGILSLIFGLVVLVFLLLWRAKKLNLGPDNQILDSRYTYTDKEVKIFFETIKPDGVRLYKWTEIFFDVPFALIYGALFAIFIVLLYVPEVAPILILFPLFTTLADISENIMIFVLASKYSKSPNHNNKLSFLTRRAMIFTRIKFVLLSFSLAIILIGGIIKYHSFFFPLRVPIVFGSILLFFPILANTIASALFQNLFVMRGSRQLAAVLVGSTMAALMVSFTSEQILEHTLSVDISPFIRYGAALIFLLPTWIQVIRLSLDDFKLKNEQAKIWVGSILGTVFSFVFGYLVIQIGAIFKRFLDNNILSFSSIPLFSQYLSTFSEENCLGLALGISGFVIYVAVIVLYKPGEKAAKEFGEAPALLYVLLLIWILTGIFSSATLYLDRYHVPVFLAFIALSGIMYFAFEVDHYFKVTEIESPQDQLEKMKNFSKAIKKRLEKQAEAEKTLVVVAASGGGIQAAGWTVQVLNGLQEELGPSFTQAIGLISSVSGGSVGTMFFLDWFTEGGFPGNLSDEDLSRHQSLKADLKKINEKVDLTQKEKVKKRQARVLEEIFKNSTEDNLDAVGWGLAYPDLVRIWFPPLAGGEFNDRGYAIEDDWKVNMLYPKATLADRRAKIFEGQIPIPVFNATLVEDGRRFLISPMTFIKDNEDAERRKAFDFNTLFNNSENRITPESIIYDLNVTTAARLSASFPYVSPIARNNGDFIFNYHVADGGYFDNSGMFTAVEWLDKYLDDFIKDLNIKRILLLQINASPEAKLPNKGIKGGAGWFMEWIGPLMAVYSVRDSTQASRNSKEVELLAKRAERKGITIKPFVISFPEDYKQPLSWKLTEQQKENLRLGWKEIKGTPTFQQLQELWQTEWNIPHEWE